MLGELETILSGMSTTSNSNFEEIKDLLGTINTNASSTKSNTATNNTASKTGILSQKESYVIDLLENKQHGTLNVNGGSTNNWVCPAGIKNVLVALLSGSGGGGGGAGGYSVDRNGTPYYQMPGSGGSGASGSTGQFVLIILPVVPGSTYNIVAGAAGTGGAGGIGLVNINPDSNTAVNGSNGGNGGDSKFGSIITVQGGKGGEGGKFVGPNTTFPAAAKSSLQSSVSTKYPVLNFDMAVIGNDGKKMLYNNEYSPTSSTAGGLSASLYVNNGIYLIKSGSGGAGGGGSYGKTGNGYGSQANPGSAGSSGSAGFVQVIW